MSIGLRTFFRKSANQSVNASAALVDLADMSVPVAANQKVHFRAWVPFTVAATGGFRFKVTVPAAGTAYLVSFTAIDGVAAAPGSEVSVVQTAAADFANAWAVAGTHYLLVEGDIVNGATAGNIKIQMACNTAANGITAIAGSSIDVVTL
jgi:hypothetical protein